jgi:hypothetical protein
MKTITVKAIFRGQDGSCGYETNKEYELLINYGKNNVLWIEREMNDFATNNGYCEYGSVISFLENWDNIRVIN